MRINPLKLTAGKTKLHKPLISSYLLPVVLLCCALSFAAIPKRQQANPVAVQGELDPKLMQIISANANTCCQSLNNTYFKINPDKTLVIYASQTLDEARRLIEIHGHSIEAGQGLYVPSVPALYTYITVDNRKITLEPMFAGIAEYLVSEKFTDAPEWLRTGLISFFSDNACIIDGKLTPAGPDPQAGLALKSEVEADTRLNIKKLYVSSDERFREWPAGKYLASALLCWMNQNGYLDDYVLAAAEKGYNLEVLEEATGESAGKINIELKRFIEGDYTTAANLAQAEQLQEPNEKETALKNVLTEKPDYFQARLALAKFYYENDNYQLCQETLMPVLAQPENKLYFPAAKISAAVLYEQKNYAQANELYQALWKQSCSYVYKYQLAYKIAG
ncbi:MAG: hypothetical protein WC374_12800, partial [Phycisphaerae bacterium]